MEKLTTLTMNGKTYGSFAGNLPQPATAKVGQVLVVAAVDDDGNVTEVEAIDQSSGGGGDGSPRVIENVVNIGSAVSVTAEDIAQPEPEPEVPEVPENYTHCLYNGVRLPKIPEEAVAVCPYYFIRYNGTEYNAIMGDYPWRYIGSSVLTTKTSGTFKWKKYKAASDMWELSESQDESDVSYMWNIETSVWQPVFSSHDILHNESSIVYFAGSEPVPTE